ncbi:hypothetical protein BABINDRAFT_41630 [Babjeviella inositovora NRRL Y-12698]|uniref:Elongator complex protein 2 n=1 Tax=Babjeviella inositovora NRRL Y-12698 TaxID=984486 RepID=A0A1E3QJ51_9ASCO|nr:uncharacterized protein BABINDRAFT_41630 [Babjeviella inositovora NRRL Y-12698]ODQ77474.1 hypothetical protein BABINDRAFT_41630 [Babjeviella inositovora NRRL Y-12698]
MPSVESISIGANRQTHVSDVHPETHHIAYGANTTVALWNPLDASSKGVYKTLNAHTKEVTSVKFMPGTPFLISAAEDCDICIWKQDQDQGEYALFQTLTAFHTASVTCMAVFGTLLATGSSDGKIFLWGLQDGLFVQVHSFRVRVGYFPLCLALQRVEANNYLLAVGGTHVNMFVYSFGYGEKIDGFTLSATLPGHEDWIKAIAFKQESVGNWLVALGSQDRYIRLWRFRINEYIDNSDEDLAKLILLTNKQYKFAVNSTKVAINFDSLIMGHDDWITSLNWHPSPGAMYLLSSCADTSLMIWSMDQLSGIWCCVSRLGEISIKGASTATGAAGGFWSALWFEDAQRQWIVTNGKTGSFRVYSSAKLGEAEDKLSQWDQNHLGISGATKSVTDLSWALTGDYLMYTSLDQTTRLLAQWTQTDGRERSATWHEFARPQIHGYDMVCLKPIDDLKFVSGGDEKLLRIFELPRGVAEILGKFSGAKFNKQVVSDAASLPVLGLSNKATAEEEEEETEATNITYDTLQLLTQPPLEDHLQRHTLYPEMEKLYGHGYELVTVDVSRDGKTIASSCRSNSKQHATVRLFQNGAKDDWLLSDNSLSGHSLTVTRVKFSADDTYLLSVSRDRSFVLWEKRGDGYAMAVTNEKAHSRIIWDCSWGPDAWGNVAFFTGSRDKTVKFWEVTANGVELIATLRLQAVVTAVDVHRDVFGGKAVLAVGLEDGGVLVYSMTRAGEFTLVSRFPDEILPAARVNRLAWNRLVASNGRLKLAVGSEDTSVRIYGVDITS